ncbi:acylphosphatase [Staphylococcus borealis]|uniref:acylphosphatase n=1 Tax=Staphylococcus borealis TaxID=2742203 RepID=UPI000FF06BED|nr:acylphosphatase [Staphylococcus borealis]MDM7883125.1 acylphosphatase [Staphylococcus borealis]RIO91090.1 acylphosphatase [Staphylococcus haemolyticus]
MKQKHLQVFGTVQGVGFRYFTQRLANKYHVKGTVQNVDDYVEIYAIGNDDNIGQFINAVINGASPASHVTHYELEETNLSEDFTDFKSI